MEKDIRIKIWNLIINQNTLSDEYDDDYDRRSDDSDDQSDRQSDITDESGDDNDDDDDDDRDDDRDDIKGFGDIKFVGDKIYEQTDSKLNLDNGDIDIDGDIYKLCGEVYKSGTNTLYLVIGMLFEECDNRGSDEIINWNGKCYKRLKLRREVKLE